MIEGRERCNPLDAGTQINNVIRGAGELIFWKPDIPIPLTPLTKFGLGSLYEGSERQRLFVSYPWIEVPSEGRTCSTPEDTEYRTADGTCNFVDVPRMGAVNVDFIQLFPPSEPHPDPLPDPAVVAEMIMRPEQTDETNLAPFSQMCVAWIQVCTLSMSIIRLAVRFFSNTSIRPDRSS